LTRTPFDDPPLVHSVHTGRDPVATHEAKQAVKELFKKLFQLF
jgi:hypothetical protein